MGVVPFVHIQISRYHQSERVPFWKRQLIYLPAAKITGADTFHPPSSIEFFDIHPVSESSSSEEASDTSSDSAADDDDAELGLFLMDALTDFDPAGLDVLDICD